MATRRKKRPPYLRYILMGLAGAVLIGLFLIFGPNTGSLSEGENLYIRTGSKYEDVKKALKEGHFVGNMTTWELLAKRAGYPSHVRPGKYHIHPGMSNYDIVRMLRAGRQTPVKLVINKLRTKQDLINIVCQNLEADSATLRHMLSDTNYLAQWGLDTFTALCAVMPNTYEFYWNVNADNAFRKIAKAYNAFWTDERIEQAKREGLTPQQAITVASIVEEETNNNGEKPNIASVYLNRYKKGMKLQADPTVKFAMGDFTIKRITGAMLEKASAYNTYMNPGLPPGPICTPGTASIKAVLAPNDNNYLYFCAKGDGSGTHLFAATYEEHLKNARSYHRHLDDNGVQ